MPLKDATKKPNNIGELIPPATPYAQNVPPIIPREQPGLSPTSLGPVPALWTTPYDNVRQWHRPGTSQNRFPALPTKVNPQLNAAARSVAKNVVAPALDQTNADIAALKADEAQDAAINGIINVKDLNYPFTGAGRQNYACGMAPNSNIVTLRLGTQSNPAAPITGGQLFSASDAGKSVLVSGPQGGAGAVQVQDLWTTIISVQSPTQATLAAAAGPTGIATNFSGTIYWWDPAADDTQTIQQAINLCDGSNQYSRVYLPAGVYIRTGTLTNSMNMKEFYGDGMQRTVILTKGPLIDTDACNFTDQVDFKMHDMTWRGPGIDAPFGGRLAFNLFVESVLQNLSFENVEIRHVAFDAMFMNTPILTTFKNCLFNFNAGNGLNLNTAVACTFDSCFFLTNLLAGVNMTNCAALSFNACGCESNGIGYYMNGGSWAISFNGNDTEFQTQRAAKKPTSFPAVSVGSGGSVAPGTYLFNYTWLRRVTNNATPIESLPSPESSPVVVTSGGNQTISFTLPTAPTDAPFIFFANVYATNAVSGSEVFIGTFPLNPGAPTTITLNTPINLGSGIVLPVSSMVGHMYVVENSSNISITGSSCNTVPCTQSRFLLVSGSSYDVSTRDLRLIQQTSPNPDFWMEVGPPGHGQAASSRIHLECGDIASSQVLIAPGTTSTLLWLTDTYQLPSATLTGTPTAPTPATTDNSTRIATTAFVQAHSSGSNTTSQSSAYSASVGDVVLCNTSSAGFTVTLPSAAGSKNGVITIKKVSSDGNNVTISGGGANIDGGATAAFTTQYTSLTLVCDGTNWDII
jgi:hypothetical protein